MSAFYSLYPTYIGYHSFSKQSLLLVNVIDRRAQLRLSMHAVPSLQGERLFAFFVVP